MLYLGIAVFLAVITLLFYLQHWEQRQSAAKRLGRPEGISQELYEFLEKADDAYILTHETAEISCFSKFANSSVCNEVLEAIYKNPAKMFGTRNYRDRTWSVIEQRRNEMILRKEIVHRAIEVKKGISITLGDHLIEYWKISLKPSGFLVEEVS